MWFDVFRKIFYFRANQLQIFAIGKDGSPAMVALEGIELQPVRMSFDILEEAQEEEEEEEETQLST